MPAPRASLLLVEVRVFGRRRWGMILCPSARVIALAIGWDLIGEWLAG
jgi:hypothetical protein